MLESLDVDRVELFDGEIKVESDIESGGGGWGAVDGEGPLRSGVKVRGERAVGVSNISGITEGDPGGEVGGDCLKGLLVGEPNSDRLPPFV